MSKCTTDPRYRQGVYVGFDPNDAERKAREQREALVECHPMTYGWNLTRWHPKYDLPVYSLGFYKLMRHPQEDAWVVDDGLKQWKVNGTVKQITEDADFHISEVQAEVMAEAAEPQVVARIASAAGYTAEVLENGEVRYV